MEALRLDVSGGGLAPWIATTPGGSEVGRVSMPAWRAQPIALDYAGRACAVRFAVASNRWLANDVRYTLHEGEQTLATALQRAGDPAFKVEAGGRSLRWVRRNARLSLRYALEDMHGQALGEALETTGWALWRRRHALRMPAELDGAVALFLFFLAAQRTYH